MARITKYPMHSNVSITPMAHHPITVCTIGSIRSLLMKNSRTNATSGASDIASASNRP